MRVLMVSPECAPFAETGGLGAMVSSLAKALAKHAYDVRLCLPLYGNCAPVNASEHNGIPVHLGGGTCACRVLEHHADGVIYYFVDYKAYFGSSNIYCGANDGERFAFFDRAVLDMCQALGWMPDVIHGHDWTTGLIPVYLNTVEREKPLGRVATVFTIHNLQHHGLFSPAIMSYSGLPMSEFRANSLEAMGQVNFMKGGLYHATKLTTVSPRYAQEIQTPEFGCGLDDVLRFKAGDLIGILNGIDTNQWDPEHDPMIAAHYTADTLEKKLLCKRALQEQLRWPHSDALLLGVVSRLDWQKGLDVWMDVLPYLLKNLSLQAVVLGCGDPQLEARLRGLAQQFPTQLRVFTEYNVALAHKIQAGCDACLIPSRFEPCGLSQMYAMRYGTLPIVRATGGLYDTVKNANAAAGTGCGFVFSDLTNDALYHTIAWVCELYQRQPTFYQTLQQHAMRKDFSWMRSVRKYEQVYQWAVAQRNPRP